MEKYIVFAPIIIFFVFFGLLIFGFLFLVVTLFIKGKNASWSGKVIYKNDAIREDMDSNISRHIYTLRVRYENNETHSIQVSKDFFDKVKVGDIIKKEKGELYPKKIS